MCAISGSFSPIKLHELYELNAYRGVISSSIGIFDKNCQLVDLHRIEGWFKPNFWKSLLSYEDESHYLLTHSQAPTTTLNSTIHPAKVSDEESMTFVWHNGLIKPTSLQAWNEILGENHEWDTQLLADLINWYGIDSVDEYLSKIKGSFACVVSYREILAKLYVFRNEISPLFVDDNLNISSTVFEGSESLQPNVVHEFNLKRKTLLPTKFTFSTLENPFWGLNAN